MQLRSSVILTNKTILLDLTSYANVFMIINVALLHVSISDRLLVKILFCFIYLFNKTCLFITRMLFLIQLPSRDGSQESLYII